MSITKERYKEKMSELQKELSLSNVFEVPRITKAVVNVGIGRALQDASKSKDFIKEVQKEITDITGQKPIVTKARKSIASFNIREGDPLGVKVTLRGKRMYDFIDRLVHIALPRSRDFKGISLSAIDESGNLTIGIREHTVFPEVADSNRDIGLQATFVSTAENRDDAIIFFRSLGFPLKVSPENDDVSQGER